MYERVYGDKYNRELSTTEIAARIRADIKGAIAAGELPRGIKVSVRTSYFSGGSSIDLKITAFPGRILRAGHDHARGFENYFTPEAYQAKKTLQAIMDAYNHDGSDITTDYFDVRFYGHAEFDWRLEQAERKADKANAGGVA
jgi:hypothetical protein